MSRRSRNRILKCALVSSVVVITALPGCVNMSPAERHEWARLKQQQVSPTSHKSPAAAGLLNLLPGIGNFYLASGTEEKSQVGVGIANLLLWPLSTIWGIPQAAVDADTYNKKLTARASLEAKITAGE